MRMQRYMLKRALPVVQIGKHRLFSPSAIWCNSHGDGAKQSQEHGVHGIPRCTVCYLDREHGPSSTALHVNSNSNCEQGIGCSPLTTAGIMFEERLYLAAALALQGEVLGAGFKPETHRLAAQPLRPCVALDPQALWH